MADDQTVIVLRERADKSALDARFRAMGWEPYGHHELAPDRAGPVWMTLEGVGVLYLEETALLLEAGRDGSPARSVPGLAAAPSGSDPTDGSEVIPYLLLVGGAGAVNEVFARLTEQRGVEYYTSAELIVLACRALLTGSYDAIRGALKRLLVRHPTFNRDLYPVLVSCALDSEEGVRLLLLRCIESSGWVGLGPLVEWVAAEDASGTVRHAASELVIALAGEPAGAVS